MKSSNIIYSFYVDLERVEATFPVLICIFNITLKPTVKLDIVASFCGPGDCLNRKSIVL